MWSQSLEEWACLDDFFVVVGKIPSHNARVYTSTDDFSRVELKLEDPRS